MLIPAIVAVVLGHKALGQIRRSNGSLGGGGLAVGGLVTGYIGILLGIVSILGMMAALILPALSAAQEAATSNSMRIASAKQQIKNLASAVDIFEVDTGTYPASLNALLTNPGVNGWDGPYMKGNSIPNDPWGVPYQYSTSGNGYDIKSPGPAGKNTPISLND
jgi:general secretion pathway protein G